MRFAWATIAILAVLALLVSSPPTARAVTPAFSTTSLTPWKASQTSELGNQGVAITYNSTFAASEFVLVCGSVVNQAGQTVSILVQGGTVPAGGSATFFLGAPSALHGNFTMAVFATTSDVVPISVTTQVKISL
jgi:hypothetical protein